MRLGTQISTTASSVQSFPVGSIVVNPKKKLTHLDLKVTVNGLKNGTAGSASLTLAQFLTWLSGTLITLTYGTRGRTPFAALDLSTLYQISRDRLGAIWPNSQSTGATGMLQTLAAAASANPVFYIQIPLGARWKDSSVQDLGGVGAYQARTMSLVIARGADTLPTNWSILGNVTFQLAYAEVDAPLSEPWEFVPEYRQVQTGNSQIPNYGTGGLVEFAWEKTAAASASALTNVSVTSEGADFPVHDQVAASDITNEYLADPELPVGAQWSDTYTPLVAYNTRQREREMLPGKMTFTQNGTQQLTPWVVGLMERPLVSDEEFKAEVQAAAKALQREVRAVFSTKATKTSGVPAFMQPFYGLFLATAQEADAKNLDGLRASPNSSAASPFVSAAKAAAIKAGVTHVTEATAGIPGGLANPADHRKTLSGGSSSTASSLSAAFKK